MNYLLEDLDVTRTHGSRSTSEYEGVEVRQVFDPITSNLERLCDAPDLTTRSGISAASDIINRRTYL